MSQCMHNPHSKLDVVLNECEDANEPNGTWKHLASGAMAGIVSRTATAPLDRIKVILQVDGLGKYKSFAEVAGGMYREGGIRGFWRGNGMNVMKVAPNSALTFMTYDLFKQILKTDDKVELTASKRFIAGGLAGVLSSTIIFPLDTLKTRLALRKTDQYRGIVDAATSIYRKEGIKVFYRGLTPNILGIIPYSGIELALYETLKNRWMLKNPTVEEANTFVLLRCGIVASTVGQMVAYPLALVRTKMQAPAVKDAPTSMVAVARFIYHRHGIHGFYFGIMPNFLKAAPSVAINYVVYEKCRQALGVTMT